MNSEEYRAQRQIVIDHMNRYGSITQKEAWNYGIERLAVVICRLREKGVGIKTEMVEKKNLRGNKVRFGRYSFIKKEEGV